MRHAHVAIAVFFALGATAFFDSAAQSQTVQEFEDAMSGAWIVAPGAASDFKECRLVLSKENGQHGHSVSSNECPGPLAKAAGWGIVERQLAVFDAEGGVIAAMGGNQTHLSGKTAQQQPIELRRPEAPTQAGFVERPSPTTTTSQLEKAIAGEWIARGSKQSQGASSCRLNLKLEGSSSQYALENAGCSGELALAIGWSIVDNKLALRDSKGENFVFLVGNQFQLSGKTRGGEDVVLVRTSPPPISPTSAGRTCVYLGYSSSCANPAELAAPSVPKTGTASVLVLVKLNLRREPSLRAAVVREISPRTCLAVDKCEQASDGIWCHARAEGAEGWIKKQVVRQQRWPVVTFANACPPGQQ